MIEGNYVFVWYGGVRVRGYNIVLMVSVHTTYYVCTAVYVCTCL